MTSTDALIVDLSAELAPVRRRSMSREAALLIALAAAELVLLLGFGATRPDLAKVILAPFMAWKIGSLAVLATVTCAVALRSFVPPALSRSGLMLALGLAALTIVAGTAITSGVDSARPLAERLMPMHGLRCVMSIVVLAMPIMAALAMLMRRAAPVRPRETALACGVGAATSGALIFTVRCPMNDPLYVAVWYPVAVATVAVAARWLLPRRFRL